MPKIRKPEFREKTGWYSDYISCTTGVQGGYPCIRGSRFPVRSVVLVYEDGGMEALRDGWPHFPDVEWEAALAYYADNPWIIETDIWRQERASEEFQASKEDNHE